MKKFNVKNFTRHCIFALMGFVLLSCAKEKEKQQSEPTSQKEKVKDENYPITQNPDIFTVHFLGLDNERKNYDAFVSLSDILQDEKFVTQEMINKGKELGTSELHSIELPKESREKLLKIAHLSETDTAFIYDYETKLIQKKPINQLKAVAYLSGYSLGNEDLEDYDYMIGFLISENMNYDDSNDVYNEKLAYFGKENPFITTDLIPIQWQKTNATEFPIATENTKKYLTKGDIHKAKYRDHWVFIQDFLSEGQIAERLLVYTDKNKKALYKTVIRKGEGDEFTNLNGLGTDENIQWIGKMFKNKPPVIFGFISGSFGCSSILFLQKDYPVLSLNCDNRH